MQAEIDRGESNEATPQAAEAPKVEARPSAQESWRTLREKAERAERERDEAIRYAKELEARKQQSIQADVEIEEPLDLSLEDDALAEGKHLKKIINHMRRQEQKIRNYEQQSTVVATETRLKMQYPDFDSVVSQENLANLRAVYPEIAATINSSNDLYNKAVTAYTMIKKLGILPEDNFQQEKQQAQKNALKPKPTATISPQHGDTPLSRANAFAAGKLTDDLKKQLLKEMYESRAG